MSDMPTTYDEWEILEDELEDAVNDMYTPEDAGKWWRSYYKLDYAARWDRAQKFLAAASGGYI